MWDFLWCNVNVATMTAGGAPYGAVEDAAIGYRDGVITWVGARQDLRRPAEELAAEVGDGGGGWITPGLIDPHTHLVYAGNRAQEFEMRLQGASYQDIARAGGGILSTVRASRAATADEIELASSRRLAALMAEGVTTVEIKSGYGLERDTEVKLLRVARRMAERHGLRVLTTFLGAHALPPEFAGRPDAYISLVCEDIMPAAAEYSDAVDAYCERIAFSPAQTARVFDAATSLRLPVKLHADQFSDLGGAALAAKYNALSADHLEHTGDEGVRALAQSGVAAVLLPGAFYFLRETVLPPIESLRRHRVPIALGTDCNPGSSPVESPLLVLNLACQMFGMTPEEALAGMTRCAAVALGLGDSLGTLEVGKAADLVLWDIATPAELAYRLGGQRPVTVVRSGAHSEP